MSIARRPKRQRTADAVPSPPPDPRFVLDEPTADDLARFGAWFELHGAVAPHVECRVSHGGLGLFASQPIPAGTDIASIPATIVLSDAYVRASEVGVAVSKLRTRHRVSARTLMWLTMAHERANPLAPFHLYLRSLPASFDTPLYWNSDTLAALVGTNLFEAVPNKLRQLKRRWSNVVPLLCQTFPSQFVLASLQFEHFLWAATCFSSRGFPTRLCNGFTGETHTANGDSVSYTVSTGIPRSLTEHRSPDTAVGCMLPFLDLTNHRMKTAITWTAVPRGARHPHDTIAATNTDTPVSHTGRVVFTVGSSIASGAELYNNYGAKSNEEFLLGYGFCIVDNSEDEYTVQVGGVDSDRAAVLADAGISWNDRGFYLRLDGIPADLYRVMRVAAMNTVELNHWSITGADAGVAALDFVSDRNEMAALSLLRSLIQARLTKLGHSSISDAEAAQCADQSIIDSVVSDTDAAARHCRLAVIYRHGQRQILINCIRLVEQKLTEAVSSDGTSLYRTVTVSVNDCGIDSSDASPYREWLAASQVECAADLALSTLPLTRAIAPFDTILSLPLTLLLSPLSQSRSFDRVVELVAGLTDKQLLVLQVLHELSKGENSRWYPFLQAARQHIRSPFADATEVSEPSTLKQAIEESLLDCADLHSQLFPALTQAKPKLFPADIHTYDIWRWATAVVEQRSITVSVHGVPVLAVLPLVFVPVSAPHSLTVHDVEMTGSDSAREARLVLRTLTSGAVSRSLPLSLVNSDSEDALSLAASRGEWHTTARHSIVKLTADAVMHAVGTLSDRQRELFDRVVGDEEPFFLVSDRGGSPALIFVCCLSSMTDAELAATSASAESPARASPSSRVKMGGSGQLDSDEESDEETAPEAPTAADDDGGVTADDPQSARMRHALARLLTQVPVSRVWPTVHRLLQSLAAVRVQQSETSSFSAAVAADWHRTLQSAVDWAACHSIHSAS